MLCTCATMGSVRIGQASVVVDRIGEASCGKLKGYARYITAGLSFLGLGVAPPTPEWGRMVFDGHQYLLHQWWATTFPGPALFLVVVGFNLLGEIVRDWLDPTRVYQQSV